MSLKDEERVHTGVALEGGDSGKEELENGSEMECQRERFPEHITWFRHAPSKWKIRSMAFITGIRRFRYGAESGGIDWNDD